MPRFLKVLFTMFGLVVVAGLVAAHWLVMREGAPTYLSDCAHRPHVRAIHVSGFAPHRDPTALSGCYDGAKLPLSAASDTKDGVLKVWSSDRRLLQLAASPPATRMYGSRIDHSLDAWWIRGLELVTPFASLDQTQPYQQESPPGGPLPVEVGHPRATTEQGEYVLRFNVGAELDDRSFSLYVGRRSA
jgi:hypothetical protein